MSSPKSKSYFRHLFHALPNPTCALHQLHPPNAQGLQNSLTHVQPTRNDGATNSITITTETCSFACPSSRRLDNLTQDHDKRRLTGPLRTDSRIFHSIDFILQFLNSGREFINKFLIFDQSSSRRFIDS